MLGFEAAVPRSGGYVVTGGGTVMLVTLKEYQDYKEFPQEAGRDASEDVQETASPAESG